MPIPGSVLGCPDCDLLAAVGRPCDTHGDTVRTRIMQALANGPLSRRWLREAVPDVPSDHLEIYCRVLVEDGKARYLPDDGTDPARYEAV